jgi:RNA polymerase sigma factor (sigma-70 family)
VSSSSRHLEEAEVAAHVRAAADGDTAAWDALVAQFGGLVWSITRAHRLSDADAADVSQTTWLRLVEHLDRIRNPERVGSWLAATARNECLRVLRLSGRHVLVGDDFDAVDEDTPSAAAELFLAERDAALWRAFQALPPRCRALLQVIVASPAPSYEELSAALEMPIGSIGPTRARCLERLRRHPDIAGILVAGSDS